MKIEVPKNICKHCYDNLSEVIIKDPKTKKVIQVCEDCYLDYYEKYIVLRRT
jgi:hypothetical protein